MRKLFLLFAILLVCAPAGLAQDYSNWEFFIGYAHERANNGADRLDRRGQAINPNGTTSRVDFVSERIPYHGVTGEVVANVHRNVGLVANFSATFANTEFVDTLSGRRFDAKVSRYLLLGGPRFNWRNSSRAIPYAHALLAWQLQGRLPRRRLHLSRYKRDCFRDGAGRGPGHPGQRSYRHSPIQVD